MKKLLKLLIITLILVTFMSDGITKVSASNPQSEIVIDVASGRILHAKNENEKMPIASLTKILTCITAIKNCESEKEILIKKEWTNIEGSSIYLKEGEIYSLKELLYGLMLRSGNDCAVSIASAYEKGYDEFIKLMNLTAYSFGAENSSFVNPHGLDNAAHYSTAYDLALITKAALSDDFFSEIVSSKSATIGRDDYRRTIYNKNKILKNYEYATGVKTGYTKKAGRCLVTSSDKNDFKLVSVVLNCGPMYERSKELLETAYSEYNNVLLCSKNESCATYEDLKGRKIPCYVSEDVYYPLKENEMFLIEKRVMFNKQQSSPINFGCEMGAIKFFLKKQLLFERKIYNIIE